MRDIRDKIIRGRYGPEDFSPMEKVKIYFDSIGEGAIIKVIEGLVRNPRSKKMWEDAIKLTVYKKGKTYKKGKWKEPTLENVISFSYTYLYQNIGLVKKLVNKEWRIVEPKRS